MADASERENGQSPYHRQTGHLVDEALRMMQDKEIRRLPVVDDAGGLVGIVSQMDLSYASPSPATSLSIHEIHYLLSRLTVQEVMTKEVVTVEENTPGGGAPHSGG